MPHASPEDIQEFYGAGMSPVALDLVSEVAADTVADLADVPDPVTTDFTRRAARAELLIGRFVKTNGYGSLKSKSFSGLSSKTFASLDDVKELAAAALGPYYAGSGGSGSGGSGVGIVTTFPF